MTAAVVLFEGCGGSTRGLHDAGYTTTGYEYWPPAVTCAQANGFDARLHDLSDPTLDHLVPYAPLWWASPPCQPFSAAGAGEGEFDGRDGFPWLLRLVALRLPDVLIVENVKGLTFAKHSAYLCAVLEGFRALGYDVDWRVLNCADFGVPQTRERCIIVCRRDGLPITWPMPTHTEQPGMFTAPWVTMADALGWGMDRPSFTVLAGGTETGGAESFSNASRKAMKSATRNRSATESAVGVTDEPSSSIAEHVQYVSNELVAVGVGGDGQGDGVLRHSIDHDVPAGDVKPWPYFRPATTIAGDNRVFQPGGHHEPGEQSANAIRLTTTELAALQGFPADWTWTGTKTQQARMVGNAVPPRLAEVVARANQPAALECAA